MSLISIYLLFLIFISILYSTTCLPVTSKPIENTPEHLAWEAWIMVPSSHDKSRKITPKSIFIVPGGTNNGGSNIGVNGNRNSGNDDGMDSGGRKNSLSFMPQIQCPPGHTVDNFKCIPTVSIDQNQILITRLTNLLHHATDNYNDSKGEAHDSYDYDYEYDTYESASDVQSFSHTAENINENNKMNNQDKNPFSSDYVGEPLKINLSFGKFPPIFKDEKNINVRDNKDNYTDFNVKVSNSELEDANVAASSKVEKNNKSTLQPFRVEETLSTTISSTTTSEVPTSTSNIDEDISTTTSNEKSNQPTTKTLPKYSSDTEIRNSNFTNIATSNFSNIDFSVSDENPLLHNGTFPINSTTSPIPILSPSESEMLTTINDKQLTTNKDEQDYDFDGQTTLRPTTTMVGDLELMTNNDESKTDDINDEIKKDSLIIEAKDTTKTTSIDDINETTVTEEEVPTTTQLTSQIDGDQTETILSDEIDANDSSKSTVSTIKSVTEKSTTVTSSPLQTRQAQHSEVYSEAQHPDQSFRFPLNENSNLNSKLQPEMLNESFDTTPITETVESNNRYIYHHLGVINSSSHPKVEVTEPTTTVTTSTTMSPEINEQLRIINKIVEENKRRLTGLKMSSGTKHSESQIRFPENNQSYENYSPIVIQQSKTLPNSRHDNVRSDFIRFPEDLDSSSSSAITIPNGRVVFPLSSFHHKSSAKPYYPSSNRRFIQQFIPSSELSQIPPIPSKQLPSIFSTLPTTIKTTLSSSLENGDIQQQNSKPFWWLPTGWEVDRTGDKPVLARFWSRVPIEPSPPTSLIAQTGLFADDSTNKYQKLPPSLSSSSTSINSSPTTITTSRYRENSRSPTEDFYKQELNAQQQYQQQDEEQIEKDIYRVLGTKQWKHNNR